MVIRLAVISALMTLFSTGFARADKFEPTIYSDGASCPNSCDAHVVFNKAHNGSRYASLPGSARSAPVACVVGQSCRICFDDADDTCTEAIYRGGGPAQGRFDFTPAYFESACPKPDLPHALAAVCASFESVFRTLTRQAVYCLNATDDAGCAAIVAKAEAAKAADKPFWDECRQLGLTAFNKKYAATPAKQRDLACAYELHGTGGPNSKGQTWRRLLPAACQEGAFVDRDGLDCCDSNTMSLGGFGKQCAAYLLKKE
jgi:hypothetical protein